MAEEITKDEWQQLVNDVEHIKASTQSMNRIMVMSNSGTIRSDILRTINGSYLNCAALCFCKELISAKDFAKKIGIDEKHLRRQINALLQKSYIIPLRVGRQIYYQREEKVDLVGFDNLDEVKELMARWEENKKGKERKCNGTV